MAADLPSTNVGRSAWARIEQDNAALAVARALQRLFILSDYHPDADDTAIRYLILNPNQDFRNAYYLHTELFCVVNDRPDFHYRDLERCHAVALRYPQLNQRVFFVVATDSRGARHICGEDAKNTHRDYIVIDQRRLCAASSDGYLRELLRNVLQVRDHFNEKNPVSSDAEFFARGALVDGLIGSVENGRCSAVLGLRRIGKTSVLRRVELVTARLPGNDFWTHYLNAHRLRTTGISAADTLLQACRGIEQRWHDTYGSYNVQGGDIPSGLDLGGASDYFDKYVKRFLARSKRRLLLIIDDFQELIPNATRDSSWNRDYLGFASTLKSLHLEHPRQFVFLLASTNPNFIRQEFHGVQNPLLASIDDRYVELFTIRQLTEMLQNLGRPMGVTLSQGALAEIYRLFGGHPFLSRQFCSILCERVNGPITFTTEDVRNVYAERQGLLDNDFLTILENLRVIFPTEYRLVLEMAANSRHTALSDAPAIFRDNLVGYGVSDRDGRFRMAAMQTYLRRIIESDRFGDVSSTFEEIEAGLRQLVRFVYRATYQDGSEALILRKVAEILGDTPATAVQGDAASRLRLCRFPALAQMILSDWDVLGSSLGDKQLLSECLSIYRTIHQLADDASAESKPATVQGADYKRLRTLHDKVRV